MKLKGNLIRDMVIMASFLTILIPQPANAQSQKETEALSATPSSIAGATEEIERWQKIFDEVLHETARQVRRYSPLSSSFEPDIDIAETNDTYIVICDLPGVEKDDVEIEIKNETLTVSGKRNEDYPEDAAQMRRERRFGFFERSFTFPGQVDTEKTRAVHENGVLKVTLPKLPEQPPVVKKVEIA